MLVEAENSRINQQLLQVDVVCICERGHLRLRDKFFYYFVINFLQLCLSASIVVLSYLFIRLFVFTRPFVRL